jgi:leucine dehydrogenase
MVECLAAMRRGQPEEQVMQMQPISSVFDNASFDDHQEVVFVRDRPSGLKAIIAMHDTSLGPALGGCRMWPYESEAAALRDVLRLSRGMTYKNALAGLDFGGAKAVIIGDAHAKTPAMLRAFGRAVDHLGGRYITGEDVGIAVSDMEIIRSQTAHVRGIQEGGVGDPSPYTALGVLAGMRTSAAHALGSADLGGVGVAVQGLGHVGWNLCRLLHEAGARLIVADIDQDRVGRAVADFGAEAVAAERAHAANADIFAPCALGAVLNERTIPEIRARIVAGAANNQLATAVDGWRLIERNILYAPDYAINAGGAIAIAHEGPNFDRNALERHVEMIGETLARIFEKADAVKCATSEIADLLAEERLTRARWRQVRPIAARPGRRDIGSVQHA